MNKDQQLLAEAYEKVLREDSFDFSDNEPLKLPKRTDQQQYALDVLGRKIDKKIIPYTKNYDMNGEIDLNHPAYKDPKIQQYLAIKKDLQYGKFKEAIEKAIHIDRELVDDINSFLPDLKGVIRNFD